VGRSISVMWTKVTGWGTGRPDGQRSPGNL